MIYTECLLKVIKFPYISEKSSSVLDKNNVIVFKVEKFSTTVDIKNSVCMLFSVKVKKVNVLMVSEKLKKSKHGVRKHRSSWKKAYVVLQEGYKIDLFDKVR